MQLHLVTASQRHSVTRQHLVTRHTRTRHVTSPLDIFSAGHKQQQQLWLYDWIHGPNLTCYVIVSLIGSLSHWGVGPSVSQTRLGDVNCAIKMLVSANGDICHTRAPTHPNISTNEHFTYGTALKLTPTLSFQIVSNGVKIILQCVLISAENVSIRDHNFF